MIEDNPEEYLDMFSALHRGHPGHADSGPEENVQQFSRDSLLQHFSRHHAQGTRSSLPPGIDGESSSKIFGGVATMTGPPATEKLTLP
jgi:hypothetical protein